jgi:Fic/DOC family protein
MPDWDEDSPQLQENLRRLLRKIRDAARSRKIPTVEDARGWHTATMRNLQVSDPRYIGHFRGESGLEHVLVRVRRNYGVSPEKVAAALRAFEGELQRRVNELDARIPVNSEIPQSELLAVVELCAWAHAEWVRIHPFANGNGRTARLWANCLAMRYGLPPFARLRPRPGGDYGGAAEAAMHGDWKPTVQVFFQLLKDY